MTLKTRIHKIERLFDRAPDYAMYCTVDDAGNVVSTQDGKPLRPDGRTKAYHVSVSPDLWDEVDDDGQTSSKA